MNSVPFINIHTHKSNPGKDVLEVKNLFPQDKILTFTGNNYYSVGLHPWNIKSSEENNKQLDLVKRSTEYDHVLFVGECGLDRKVHTDFSEQIRVFETQALIAEMFRKPLIIHCVNAFNEIIRLNKKLRPEMSWIFHGYNGNLQTTKQMTARNFFFSFGEALFNTKSRVIESFQFLPTERIFFETDESQRSIIELFNRGAELKNIKAGELKKVVFENFHQLKKE